ncbi:4-(cytidine 5'-diphospho)-2-C-methyl-D-erythritol kinase [candidate division NPL-UPA2 bacterium]|nr:4-(cytidine 5'-diphospho)-2-C-methyl-D-erythritol kinase [candidate division NPL-UPA2 bacterium]
MQEKGTGYFSVKVLSPAKINLFLEVLSKREDGYHEIETVLQAIDIHDEVTLRDRKEGIKIICPKEGVPRGKGNLAYRAAEIILEETCLQRGVEIEIKKEIPIAAGLGGGSSNAAAVLVGLKELWNLRLSKERLQSLAKGLGMDVPFFIKGGRALGKGRGEELTSLREWEPFWLTIVVPDFKVSTAWVYQGLNLGLTRKRKQIKIINDLKTWSGRDRSSILYNRLEEVTEKKYPQVRRLRERLEALGGAALMSGSGPAIFGIFPERHYAERAGAIIEEELTGSPEARKPGSGKEEVYVTKTFSGGASIVKKTGR